MFGFTIVRKKEFAKMQQLDSSYRGIINGKDSEISSLKLAVQDLSEKLAKFDRKRVAGKLVKSTI